MFDRANLSADEDVAVITMHYQKHISLAPDLGPITDTERDDFADKITTWWAAVNDHVTGSILFREIRHYDVPSTSSADMGDPQRVDSISVSGDSSSQVMPPQVSCSVTLRTDARKHWGRFYIPGLTTPVLDSKGRLGATVADEFADAAAALCDRSGTGAHLVVFSRTLWLPQRITQVQVDDVLDVIRRRRFSATHYRAANDV